MAAPINGFVANSGSLFKIDKHMFDLEKVDGIKTKPIFPGSGSIKPTIFTIIVNDVEKTIDNSEAIELFNKESYLFPSTISTINNLGQLLNLKFRYSSSLNIIIISPPGNFVNALDKYYGLTQANISKSFQNEVDLRISHNFNATSLTYVGDMSSSLYGLTYINLNTSSLGSDSTGSIYITQSRTEYNYDYISASIDLYNSFLSDYNNMSSSLKSIKGSIN